MEQSKPLNSKETKLDISIQTAVEKARGKLQKRLLGPVKRKVYSMIHDRLLRLQASLLDYPSQQKDNIEHISNRILETLNLFDDSINENAAWNIADSLKELLLEVASPDFIYRALVEETRRDPEDVHYWGKYFPLKDLWKFIIKYEEDPDAFNCHLACERLKILYKNRNDLGRHNRARDRVRWVYLYGVSLLLLPLCLLVLFWDIESNSQSQVYQMGIVLVAGAIGAVLSGAIKLRDLGRIVELKGAWMTLFPQMILGATLAMIVVLILRTDFIKIGNIDFQFVDENILFIVGFISGFSEPFALGIIERITKFGN
jgi:hypothetical protein